MEKPAPKKVDVPKSDQAIARKIVQIELTGDTGSSSSGWHNEGLCKTSEVAAQVDFFPRHKESGLVRKDERDRLEAKAAAVCGTCAVEMECLAYSVINKEPNGIWGGKNEEQRRAIRKSYLAEKRKLPRRNR